MTQLLQVVSYWKLFVFKSVNGAVKTLALAISSVLTGADWSEMTRTQHIIATCVIAAQLCNYFEALIDKTFSSLSTNNPKKLFSEAPSGQTEFLRKIDVFPNVPEPSIASQSGTIK